MLIIGITGTLGAGKGTIVEYLVKKHNFKHYSVRSYLTKIINKRNIPLNRDSMVQVANEIRKKYTPSFIVEELLKEASKNRKDAIIESIRTVGEIEALDKNPEFYLFAVDANPKLRYKRIISRKSETDSVSYEKFRADEENEMESLDPNKQNISKCIAMADFVFDNNGNLGDLYDQIEKAIKQIQKN